MSAVEEYEIKNYEKDVGTHTVVPAQDGEVQEAHLHRGLKSRHMAMISIGGVIGTGLFLGTGGALAHGGPLGLFLGYTVMATVCLSVMLCLGEMISYLPIEGGHLALANRFVDPAWGFALSFNYAYNWLIILPAEISAVAVLVNFWTTAYSNGIWIAIALVIVIVINLFGSRGYGEAEFFFASIKVLTIIGLIIAGIAINCGAGPAHQGYIGFRYWKHPGPFVQYEGIAGSLGKFLGFWAVLTQAAFSFIGTEIVAIAAGEAQNPRRNLPKAIKTVYIRILVFYILGTFIIGLNISSANERLGAYSDARASPFVLAIQAAGIKTLPSIINACLVTSAWSAASSDMYASSRAIYSIALAGNLPKIFLRTTSNGLPWAALIISALFGLLAFMSLGSSASNAFNWFANMTAIAGLMSWFAIAVTYTRFRAGMEAQGMDRNLLPFKSRFSKFGAWYAIFMIIVIQFFSAWNVFLKDNWNTATFVTNYLPLVIFPALFFIKKFWSKTQWRRPADMDFISGIAEIEADSWVDPPHPKWWGRALNAIF